MKKCNKCKIEKEESEFSKNQKKCKSCNREYRDANKARMKEYRTLNKDDIRKNQKEYNKLNKDDIRKNQKEYQESNKEKIREYQKEYQKDRYNSDPYYRFISNLRSRIKQAFKFYSKNGKTKSCTEYGIDVEAIYDYIGEKPEGNYHLDHIIPISAFDLDNPEHVRLAHLPQNLRWLNAEDNISKSDSIEQRLIGCKLSVLMIALEIGLPLVKYQ